MSELIERLTQIILRDFPDAQAIYLYGSYARGEQRPDSDIDLAVLLPHARARAVGSLTMSQTQLDLAHVARRDVDLVNLRVVSPLLQTQATGHGKLIFEGDANARMEFEMMALSMFQDVNQMRGDVVNDYLQSRGVKQRVLVIRDGDLK